MSEKIFKSAVSISSRLVDEDMERPTDRGIIWAANRIDELEAEAERRTYVIKSKWREEYLMWRDYCLMGSIERQERASRMDVLGEVLRNVCKVDPHEWQKEIEAEAALQENADE